MSFPKLVSDVISKARERYGDMTNAKALDYFLIAWRNLADEGDLRYKSQNILLTAGTREYAIPDDVIDISAVYYMPSSDPTTWTQLYIRSVDYLDQDRFGWRQNASQGAPFEFYIQTAVGDSAQLSRMMIGFVQIPPTTSSGGYPCVGIFGQAVTDLATTDNLPAFTSTDSYFVASIKRQYAEQADSGSIGLWIQIEDREKDRLLRHMKQFAAHQGTRIQAAWATRTSRAR